LAADGSVTAFRDQARHEPAAALEGLNMSVFLSLSSLALRQLVEGACAALGVKDGGEAVVGFLTERFTDHSNRLTKALRQANDNAWKALEIALAGDSLWDRCKAAVATAEDRAFARQVRAFLDATPLPEVARKTAFRQKCLEELRAARKGQALAVGTPDARQLAQDTAAFARFSDPTSRLDAEWGRVVVMVNGLDRAGYKSLAGLLGQRPAEGSPLLVLAVRYFFRRAVEDDPKLFQGLSFARLEALGEAQEQGFAALSAALTQQGERLEGLLVGTQAVVVQTHSAVLDLQGQMQGQGEQVRQIGQAVQQLLEQHQLQRRELRPGDSLSIRNDNERQLVKQLVARYRALPEADRKEVPALLNAIGKLEVVAGDFDQAQKDFQAVALLDKDNKAQAEAHHNAYLACLEKRDWSGAGQEFVKAVKLDAKRFAPFAVGKYQPVRILGAGGFGVAFLCKHKYMDAQVVVKTLTLEDLGWDADKVFSEAQVLRQLDHAAIIRISDCGYVDAANKSRPFLVMDYFNGMTLEEQVKKHGAIAVDDLLAVGRQVAEGLQAAHGKGILHRDVKPANLLVRKDGGGWKVKVIDFGLAMPQKVVETSRKGSTARQKETMVGSSIAGTLDYGAPEQMGRRKEPVGPYSDVYGWAKTCCYALFRTTQPLMKHWKSVPEPLAELLEKCLEEDPRQRPAGFAEVLKALDTGVAPSAPAAVVPKQKFDFESPAAAPPGVTTTRKKRRKSLLPFVVSGVGLLAMALVVVFLFVQGGPKKAGLGFAGRGEKGSGSQAATQAPADKAKRKKDAVEPPLNDKTVERSAPPVEPDQSKPMQLPRAADAVERAFTNTIGMKFVWIEPGTFRMGSPPGEEKRGNNETPHRVTLTKGFHLGANLVTQQQWERVMGKDANTSRFMGKDEDEKKLLPVDKVSWKDCQEFCRKLGALEGRRYRLPTEAEWEYACRAGTETAFWWGDGITTNQANYDGNYTYGANGKKGENRGKTTPVHLFAANPWGLYDMHGNLWQWCEDAFQPYGDGDKINPVNTGELDDASVLRGGSWAGQPELCRAARRLGRTPDYRCEVFGCRVVLCLD
jgi:formylglycine-generating enzyme required for sulfatase activity/serine/threonine protein kinase